MEEGDVRKSKSNINNSWKKPFPDVGLNQPLLQQLISRHFHSIIPSTFICWNSAIRIYFPSFFFLSPFIFLYEYGLMDSYFFLSLPLIFVFKLLHIWLAKSPLQAGSCVLWTCLHHSQLTSLLSVETSCSNLSCSLSVPARKKNLVDLVREWYLKNKI